MFAPRALVTTSTFPRWSGDATASFARDLAELATPEWDVTVLAPHHPEAAVEETVGPLAVRRYPYFYPRSLERLCYGGGILPNARASMLAKVQVPTFFLAQLAATRAILRSERFDLCHAHFLVPQGVVAAALLALSRTPLVVSVHGSDLFALGGAASRSMQIVAVRRATLVTVNSDATRDELVRRLPLAEGKTVTLPMGIDERRFHPSTSTSTSTSGSAVADRILFVGRLTPQKGASVLIEALPSVVARVPGAALLVVGEGPELDALRALATRRGVAERVVFAGPLGQGEIARLYRTSAVVVVPSHAGRTGAEAGAEGQGLVALEAMASGCPVVATRGGGLTRALGRDERGLSATAGDPIALADAIVATLHGREAAAGRAAAARTWVLANYTWSRLKPALLDVYAEARSRAHA